MEELVAELGAAFLCADLAVTPEPRADHASYIANWLAVLKGDKKAIFTAASKASEAAQWLLAKDASAHEGAFLLLMRCLVGAADGPMAIVQRSVFILVKPCSIPSLSLVQCAQSFWGRGGIRGRGFARARWVSL